MFTKRKSFFQGYKFNKDFLDSFLKSLEKSGFSKITIKLPHNLTKDGVDEISIDEFINRGRNYPSTILIAHNENLKETIKILFINISTKAFFKDDTFPSGHSESPELWVQTSDPVRTFGLFGYFYEYLKNNKSKSDGLYFLLGVIAFIFFILEFISLTKGDFLLSSNFGLSKLIDIILLFIIMIFQFKFFSGEGGLYIKEKDNVLLANLKRALHGDYRDNPLINLLITIAGGTIVAFLSKLLGLF